MTDLFFKFARGCSTLLARPGAFILALVVVLGWAAAGPIFRFSEAWQLVINTGTTIVTFLMVFVIQNTQNRDSKAMHLKLDELLRAASGARNRLIDVEDVSEAELRSVADEFEQLHKHYETAAARKRSHRKR